EIASSRGLILSIGDQIAGRDSRERWRRGRCVEVVPGNGAFRRGAVYTRRPVVQRSLQVYAAQPPGVGTPRDTGPAQRVDFGEGRGRSSDERLEGIGQHLSQTAPSRHERSVLERGGQIEPIPC